jgi:hypothetical protein
MLLRTTNDDQLFYFFLCFHIFISISNLIQMNTHFMDMKRHMLICFFIFMLVHNKNKWDSYKMKVIIRKGGR